MSSRLFCLAMLLVAVTTMAEPGEVVLTARPGLCILQDTELSECVMALDLKWNAARNSDFCLYHSRADAALQCWSGTSSGHYLSELASHEDVSYWLQHPGIDQQLAKITVRVVSLAQRNPVRRRRRHVWSVL
jgi:hypothetical protein